MFDKVEKVKDCLHCKNALCTKHCPIHTFVPQVITLAQNQEYTKAQELLFNHNFFSGICGLLCDHKRQCFGNCVLNFKKIPVPFYELEAQLSLDYLDKVDCSVDVSKDLRVAIVGAGVSGMALAFKLAKKGCKVTLYDDHARMGGVVRYGIPDFRLDKSIVDKYEKIVLDTGVTFIGDTTVDGAMLSQLQQDSDMLILAFGAWIGNNLNSNAKNMPNVYRALEVLDQQLQFDKDSKVIVLGGGNVAMDVARYMKRQCDDTSIYYRKEIKDMPANVDEIEELLEEHVNVVELAAPVDFDDKGIIFAKGETIVDENGKKQTRFVENSEYHVDCDVIIQAISQKVDTSLFNELNLETDKYGYIDVTNHGCTSNDNVFVCGDALLGPKSIVHCMKSVNDLMSVLEEKYGL